MGHCNLTGQLVFFLPQWNQEKSKKLSRIIVSICIKLIINSTKIFHKWGIHFLHMVCFRGSPPVTTKSVNMSNISSFSAEWAKNVAKREGQTYKGNST